MINFSFSLNILLGLILSLGVFLLYFLRNVKPELARIKLEGLVCNLAKFKKKKKIN